MSNAQTITTSYATQSLFFSFLYDDAHTAIAWLERVFGAKKFVAYEAPDGSIQHAEMQLAGNTFMLGTNRAGKAPKMTSCYVTLESAAAVDALFDRAKTAGATIVREPYDTDYGSHDFGAKDLGGNEWSFGTYRPGVAVHES